MRSVIRFGIYTIPVVVIVGAAYYLLAPTQTKKPHTPVAATPAKDQEAEATEEHANKKSGNGDSEDEAADSGDEVVAHAPKENGHATKREQAIQKSIERVKVDLAFKSEDGTCLPIEYPGAGRTESFTYRVEQDQWSQVISLFHDAKRDLANWFVAHENEIGKELATKLSARVKDQKIQRPPITDEPDLDWRGVGVVSHGLGSEFLIKTGAGFIPLVEKDPMRAKFELTRLLAQTIASCELSKAGLPDIWKPTLDCMGIDSQTSCAEGQLSESTWAISTTIANWVSSPGCKVPALNETDLAACMKSPRFAGSGTQHAALRALQTLVMSSATKGEN